MYKNYFEEEFINKINKIYFSVDKSPNTKFFNDPSLWYTGIELNQKNKEGISFFGDTLFVPNFEIIEYFCENIEIFKNKKIFDYGCGVGILSALLTKLNIDCYNYDNFNQINNKNEFVKKCNEFLNLKLNLVTNILPDEKFFAVTCSGYWITEKIINMNSNYLILDKRYNNKINVQQYNQYELINEKQFIQIFKLK
jgi:2-polyprenyl-3-methyl-5-hydroxy-6-metoxy-1,4-benzoquinol methylase